MTDIQLFTKLSGIPADLKKETFEFIDFLKLKINQKKIAKKRIPGLAKGLIKMSKDFDEPLDDFMHCK
ncbi:type II toxin-antitoxin system VapB family antitoxin [Agaribacillus aureus]|uniref:type II toxin-antitoxin system VapB family antitoxin n=1 Tax=Agaribacillus aureus TaxID=3051825 RepID=UPI003D24A0FF